MGGTTQAEEKRKKQAKSKIMDLQLFPARNEKNGILAAARAWPG